MAPVSAGGNARPLTATERTRRARQRDREALELTVSQLLTECGTWLPRSVLRRLRNVSLYNLREELIRALGADRRGEVSAS